MTDKASDPNADLDNFFSLSDDDTSEPLMVEAVKAEPEAEEENPEVNDTLELTDEDELVEDEGDKRPRSKSAKQRIDELTKARREAERERDELRQRLEAKERPQPEPQEQGIGPAPDPNDLDRYEFGESDPKYIADMARYEVRKEIAEERQRELQQAKAAQITQALAEVDSKWTEAAEKASEKYEDFAEVISEYQEKEPCPQLMAVAIQSSDIAADIAYHLAKNPEENRTLAAMADPRSRTYDPLEAARQFGRLEGRLQAANSNPEPKPEPKRATTAPEPPRHNLRGGGGKFSPDYSSENVDLDEVARAMKL